MASDDRARTAGQDLLWALVTGGAAFVVYLRTLAPGMVAVVDTPMFQFVGRVLGVAHNPGYPLYVLLTHPFSYLPIGSLAYRINLFSAICGALTVALVFLIARRLGCRRIVSAAAALGMAFGHIFWSQAVIAEVYTLDTAIVAGMVLALLIWGETGRPWPFYTAIGLFAAGLGNHTTILAFAPGVGLYAWLEHRQFVTRAQHLVTVAAIVAAGLLQYAFILIRSRTPGAYVESPATTIAELARVFAGRQFADRLFTFGWREVVLERAPWLVEHVLVPELTMTALALALVGIIWLVARRFAEGVLLLPGCLAVVVFALNYEVVDLPVFFIPATLVLWVAAAVGGEQVVRVAQRAPGGGAAVSLLLLALPAWQLVQNFGITDRSHDMRTAATFDRLFDELPDRTAIVREDFLVDRMVMYKLLGDRPAHDKRIDLVDRDPAAARDRFDQGDTVLAFTKAARQLRFSAFDFGFAPIPVVDDALPALLARLPKGRVVAVAVPAAFVDRFVESGAASFVQIGGRGDLPARPRSSLTAVGVTGASEGAVVAGTPAWSRIAIGAHEPIGTTGASAPAAIEIEVAETDAAIRQGSRDIVRSAEGAVVAIWREDGSLEQTAVLQAADDFRAPLPAGPLSVFPLRGVPDAREVGDEWTPVTEAVQTGSVMFSVPGQSTVVAYVADDAPLAPRVIDQSSGDVRVAIAPADARDGAAAFGGATATGDHHVYRIEITTTGADVVSLLVALGGLPTHAAARVEPGSRAATMFSVDTTGLLRTPDRSSEILLMARDEQRQLTGAGWSPVDWDEVSPFRWMTAREAHLVLPIAKDDARAIRIQALRESPDAPSEVRLLLDGRDLGSRPVTDGWQSYEWEIPGDLLGPGTHTATLVVDALPAAGPEDLPVRGLAVTELRVLHGRTP